MGALKGGGKGNWAAKGKMVQAKSPRWEARFQGSEASSTRRRGHVIFRSNKSHLRWTAN